MTNTAVSKASTVHPSLLAELNKEHLILTEKLVLRPVETADTDDYAKLLGDVDVMRFVGLEEGQVLSLEESTELVAGAAAGWTTRGWGRWSIFDRSNGEFIGFCGFRAEDGKPELISMVQKKFWGNGTAKEANEACLAYGFTTLGFSEVVSFTRPANARARGLLDKLGATFLGLIDFHGVEGLAYKLVADSSAQ
jgi:ribosomal-protein-alanine N-acetyltransferase